MRQTRFKLSSFKLHCTSPNIDCTSMVQQRRARQRGRPKGSRDTHPRSRQDKIHDEDNTQILCKSFQGRDAEKIKSDFHENRDPGLGLENRDHSDLNTDKSRKFQETKIQLYAEWTLPTVPNLFESFGEQWPDLDCRIDDPFHQDWPYWN